MSLPSTELYAGIHRLRMIASWDKFEFVRLACSASKCARIFTNQQLAALCMSHPAPSPRLNASGREASIFSPFQKEFSNMDLYDAGSSKNCLCLQSALLTVQLNHRTTTPALQCYELQQHPIMTDSAIPPQRRPALIPKDAILGPDDIWSICTRTGHAMVPPPEPFSVQQAHGLRTELSQRSCDAARRGTKRKASTSNDRTYEPGSAGTLA
jgi:hypothetical protein